MPLKYEATITDTYSPVVSGMLLIPGSVFDVHLLCIPCTFYLYTMENGIVQKSSNITRDGPNISMEGGILVV